MPPALQLGDWDFVSDEGLHWEVRGTVLLFPGREEGLLRALVLVGEGDVTWGRGSKHRWARRDSKQPLLTLPKGACLRALQTCSPPERLLIVSGLGRQDLCIRGYLLTLFQSD